MYLSLDTLPEYVLSAPRAFFPHEHHMERMSKDDVLILMLDGILRFEENGEELELKGGEYYIQRSGLFQSGKRESTLPKYYFIHFVGVFADNCKNGIAIRGRFDIESMLEHIDKLNRHALINASRVEICAYFYHILSELKNTKEGTRTSTADKLCSFVLENLDKKLSLEILSHKFGYCKNYIIKMFKTNTGLTPHEYILNARLEKAKGLLLSSSLTASEIAVASGFGDYVSLYKAVKRATGVSVIELRNKGV